MPHTQPVISWNPDCSGQKKLPKLLLAKGETVKDASATAALVAPDGRCWAWNVNDNSEWSTLEQAIAALRRRLGKSSPKLAWEEEKEPEPAE